MNLRNLRDELRSTYGENWFELEPESILMDQEEVTDLFIEQLNCLRVMEEDPEKFFEDLVFFLHATDVFNNHLADFETLPAPSSLDMAYSVTEAQLMYPEIGFSRGVKTGITYLLNEEGYSVPVWPFTFLNPDDFTPGQTEQDTKDKEKALRLYVRAMNQND